MRVINSLTSFLTKFPYLYIRSEKGQVRKMGYIVISIFVGILPEILYFSLFLVYTKNLKEKRIKLSILIFIAYMLCVVVQRYKVLYYSLFVFLIYAILKILYKQKAQITDIFMFSISVLYLTLLSFLIYIPKNNTQYFICLFLNRILLFIPFIFRKRFSGLYKSYYDLWNRNYTKKQPIKSITLRNISLILFNFVILVINIICLYMIDLIVK